MPSKMTMDFAGVEASASFTNPAQVGDFGLIFSGAGDQLFEHGGRRGRSRISTSPIWPDGWSGCLRLWRTIQGRRLSSMDVLLD